MVFKFFYQLTDIFFTWRCFTLKVSYDKINTQVMYMSVEDDLL